MLDCAWTTQDAIGKDTAWGAPRMSQRTWDNENIQKRLKSVRSGTPMHMAYRKDSRLQFIRTGLIQKRKNRLGI